MLLNPLFRSKSYGLLLVLYMMIGGHAWAQSKPGVRTPSSGDYYRRYLANRAYVDSAQDDYTHGRYRDCIRKYGRARRLCPYFRAGGCEYYMARCFTMLNVMDSAEYYLQRATGQADWIAEHMDGDTCLRNLCKDTAKWHKWMDHFSKARTDTGINTDLKRQLLAMRQSDQALRLYLDTIDHQYNFSGPVYERKSDSIWKIQRKLDDINTRQLQEVVARYGWPTYHLVGEEAAFTAWLVLQHAMDSLQKAYLPLLQEAVARHQASAIDLAYLTDRILQRSGKWQVYGTQYSGYDGRVSLYGVENEEELDARREQLGMEPVQINMNFYQLKYDYKD